ncbi:hypothetical protein ACICHK_34755 [Streptomyces sp. AHU1]|uniref:hypothetical protein n=1 Tax=Streptomyces sp. AHU1 TaxID=3377215 RepID=UPI003877A339
MADHLRSEDGWLILDDQQIAVEVDLGLFLPVTGSWGGVLCNLPPGLAGAIRGMGSLASGERPGAPDPSSGRPPR